MIAGHIYIVYTTLTKPPKDKITLCLCADENMFFWINTDPRQHRVGQFALTAADHDALSHDCFLDCSRVTTFSPFELDTTRHRGIISAALAQRIVAFLKNNPPKTLAQRFVNIAVANLSTLID